MRIQIQHSDSFMRSMEIGKTKEISLEIGWYFWWENNSVIVVLKTHKNSQNSTWI